jgi:hypothetical protein
LASESGVDGNLERFSAETLVGEAQDYSLNVHRLGLNPNAVQTCGYTSLGLLLFDPLDTLHDQALTVHLDTLYEPLQDELLVLALQEREVCLDAVEVWAVWDIEDRPRLQALACLKYILGLVNLQIIHEYGEVLPVELGREHLHELHELLGGDRMGMNGVGFEPSIITDRTQECHGLDADVGIVHLDALVLRRPCSRAEGVKREHGLIYPNQLHIPKSGDLDGVVHLSKEVVVVLVGVVNHLLAAVDELELDAALLVCPLEK